MPLRCSHFDPSPFFTERPCREKTRLCVATLRSQRQPGCVHAACTVQCGVTSCGPLVESELVMTASSWQQIPVTRTCGAPLRFSPSSHDSSRSRSRRPSSLPHPCGPAAHCERAAPLLAHLSEPVWLLLPRTAAGRVGTAAIRDSGPVVPSRITPVTHRVLIEGFREE